MNRRRGLSAMLGLLMTVISSEAQGQNFSTSAEVRANYNQWGWTSYVMENGLITMAVVPEIGARVMQYDLDGHPSIYINPDEIGNTYTPSNTSPWHNYGGYKVWPAPQSEWLAGGGGWPPPATLDFGAYEAAIVSDTPDSCAVYVRSPLETLSRWTCRGLRFERRLMIFKGSTRVKVEQTMINEGDAEARWSIWDVTQSIVNHPGEEDWGNFWVYFPINAESKFGEKGFYVMGGSKDNPQWKPNVAQGVSAVQYLHNEGAKIGADSDGGWIAYVDEQEGYLFAKKFAYFEGEEYPDNGASVEVYTSGGLPYLEVEVLSPLVDLKPGESYTFVEDWYAAKTGGPILEVNNAGAIRERLSGKVEGESADLRGVYGVFYIGQVEIVFRDANGNILGSGGSFQVSPSTPFALEKTVEFAPKTKRVELVLEDMDAKPVGILDTLTLQVEAGIRIEEKSPPSKFGLQQNSPNPFNSATTIPFTVPAPQVRSAKFGVRNGDAKVELAVYNILGQKVRTLVDGEVNVGETKVLWDGKDDHANTLSNGIYLCQLRVGDLVQTKRMVMMR